MQNRSLPIAYCPLNEVEAWSYPFYIKRGRGVEPDQLLLKIHLWHMTSEEKDVMGELIEIAKPEDLEENGFAKDGRGIYIVGEGQTGDLDPRFQTPDFSFNPGDIQ